MNNGILILGVALLYCCRLDDIATLLDNVQLDETFVLPRFVGDFIKLFLVQTVDISDASEPRIQDAHISVAERSLDTAAIIVSTDNDMLDVQMDDGIFNDGHDIEVGVGNEVGDIAMHENFASIESHDLVSGHTTVATSDVP